MQKRMGGHRGPVYWTGLFVPLALAVLLVGGFGSPPPAQSPLPTATPPAQASQIITLGDVDPDDPTKKIKLFQPLASYLADHLHEFGIKEGRVVVARDMEEMAQFFEDGKVDIYFDSPFPALKVQELSGSEIILKKRAPTYWSLYIARRGSGIARIEDLAGKVIAFEKPHSTSGFLLPAGTLLQRSFTLTKVQSPAGPVPPDGIGYYFSRDQKNTVEMVLRGLVAGGGLSNEAYERIPQELKEEIIAFDRTVAVPRLLVSVRPGISPFLMSKVRELLVGPYQTEEGRQILKGFKKAKKFDALPVDSKNDLEGLKALMQLALRNRVLK